MEKLKKSLENLERNGQIDSSQAKVVKKLYSDPKKLGYPGSLNDFAHNTKQVVSPSEVADFWDSYLGFFIALYKDM